MTFIKRLGLPYIRDFIFDVRNALEYTLGNQYRCHEACNGEQKSDDISAMPADLL